MIKYNLIFLIVFSLTSFGQSDNKFKYIDPYYGRTLFENYNPETLDFSKEFYKQRTGYLINLQKSKDVTELVIKYNLSNVWLENALEYDQNGIIGKNYRRINIHFSYIAKDSLDPFIYIVMGKSKVGNNICDFCGRFKILKMLEFIEEESMTPNAGVLYGEYKLNEDSSQTHSGTFNGIFE
ncbi:MAG TPA: hypothetical protein VMT35_11195, partial [Ignavibacteriaceae bacterium]|nr:hypothetical protein [Ignavibacteriaceae bacterium]